MEQTYTTFYASPVGWLKIRGAAGGIEAIEFVDEEVQAGGEVPECLQECVQQLQEYFEGRRRTFSLRLRPAGTEFQKRVWQALRAIPFGRTASYQDIATEVGNPKAVRAVGLANGRNPIPIVIPCHRVIGKNGALVGFGGGLWRKEFLLQHEQSLA